MYIIYSLKKSSHCICNDDDEGESVNNDYSNDNKHNDDNSNTGFLYSARTYRPCKVLKALQHYPAMLGYRFRRSRHLRNSFLPVPI